MKRLSFNLLTWFCALLLLATIAIWVASYRIIFKIDQHDSQEYWQNRQAMIDRGRLAFISLCYANERPRWSDLTVHVGPLDSSPDLDGIDYQWRDLSYHKYAGWGFAAQEDVFEGLGGHERWSGLMVPVWLIAIPLTVLPTTWTWRRIVRLRRQRQGKCRVCGYDLRATPEQCPECGSDTPTR